jgi:hypothetical protein
MAVFLKHHKDGLFDMAFVEHCKSQVYKIKKITDSEADTYIDSGNASRYSCDKLDIPG